MAIMTLKLLFLNIINNEFDQAGSIDPKLQGRTDRSILIIMQNKKNAEHILIDLVHFTRSAKVDFIQIDRSRIIERSTRGSIDMNHGRNNVKIL